MKPIFTIHEGEFIVGEHIIRKIKKEYDVWIPAKDRGIDLLVTKGKHPQNPVGLQVKFSRSYSDRYKHGDAFLARGWYTLNRQKIKESTADVWVFAIMTLQHNVYFIPVPIRELKKRIPKGKKGKSGLWHLYLTVLTKNRCFDTRDMKMAEGRALLDGPPQNTKDDYSEFLENWTILKCD